MNTSTPTSTSTTSRPVSLRVALLLDAFVTGANGLAYIAGAALLDSLLGPPAAMLAGIGVFLTVYAAGVAGVGLRRPVNRGAAVLVVDINIGWAVCSVVVAAGGWLGLTTIGTVWVVLQALVVGGFAALQWLTLRADR